MPDSPIYCIITIERSHTNMVTADVNLEELMAKLQTSEFAPNASLLSWSSQSLHLTERSGFKTGPSSTKAEQKNGATQAHLWASSSEPAEYCELNFLFQNVDKTPQAIIGGSACGCEVVQGSLPRFVLVEVRM